MNGGLVLLDGGFGTELIAAGLPGGADPTDWNLERPEAVLAVHRAYVEAGAEVVLANTFGANRLKYRGERALAELVGAAVHLAREAGSPRVALDLGPTGRMLAPVGDLDFDSAVAAFAETVRAGAAAGADLVLVETMGDLRELKAAVLAAKENSALPVWATVTVGEDGKLLTGASVEAVAVTLEALGVEAYGINCGLGPDLMLPLVRRLKAVSRRPVIVKPNAGLPQLVEGRTLFKVGPDEFAAQTAALVAAGADIVGGCCGTTPAHIRAVKAAGLKPVRRPLPAPRTVIASGLEALTLESGEGLIVGERINPTGKKRLQAAYRSGDEACVLREAVAEVEQGARALDINCGVPGIDEAATLARTLVAVESVVSVPIQIDTADPVALERALRLVNGKALVNSVSGKRESMAAVFPLVRKYGGVIVALCLDEHGIPADADGRLAIARRILAEGAKYGFERTDFVFDALTLAVSADPTAAQVTLETVRRLKDELGVNTILGVSNVSFGLPARPALNAAMYTLAVEAGLSAAIFNPAAPRTCAEAAELAAAVKVLKGEDVACAEWIARAETLAPAASAAASAAPGADLPALKTAIVRGLKDDAARFVAALLADGAAAMELVEGALVPALELVGGDFERGKRFLPQLLLAADAAGAAFEVLRAKLASGAASAARGRPIVLATVKGDIHDIGKNIVRSLLENYGFAVIDLGRDVAPAEIVAAARKAGAMMVGLSALMTTTVGAMAATIRELKAAGVAAKTCVGGAVVTQEYADSIGADFYAQDAMRTVRIAEALAEETGECGQS